MGDQNIHPLTGEARAAFIKHLLGDIQALEQMLDEGLVESGITRIGAEQEFCLIGSDLRPAMSGPEVLTALKCKNFTAELARWNLEINLDPLEAGPTCLQSMEQQLNQLLELANDHAKSAGSEVLLTGILPTIRKSDLDFKYMTPSPRYRVLDETLKFLRGEDFSLNIEGVDDINLRHDSILFEACNTSFQVHLQIDPDDFADKYNWSQVLAGPVLAASVNSPILMGKELWAETRIALFRQSIDVNRAGKYVRDCKPRVAFGNDWLKNSVVEIFKSDAVFYKLIMSGELQEEDSLQLLADGEIPRLRALNLHNGTVYKWNRACYGVGNGTPHLRIENRYLPAGPTPLDEMANVAFWIGLMHAMPNECRGAWDRHFHFQDVRANFLKAAQHGLSIEMRWFGQPMDAARLILDKLLPIAEAGLEQIGVSREESERYLTIIEQRVRTRQTGACWMIDSLRSLRQSHSPNESLLLITDHIRENCLLGTPVHEWKIPDQSKLQRIPYRYDRVDSLMITSVVTVRDGDLLDFAEKLMTWYGFHHLPVENEMGDLSGVISDGDIAKNWHVRDAGRDGLVKDCKTSKVIWTQPETPLEEAEQVMEANGFESLPVVDGRQVIGIITAGDIRRQQMKAR